jgi:hypothetical protein
VLLFTSTSRNDRCPLKFLIEDHAKFEDSEEESDHLAEGGDFSIDNRGSFSDLSMDAAAVSKV